MKKRNVSLKIVSAIILTGMLLCTVSACSKEAKIYPYSGKIPFDEKIEFGMHISEVENIVGKLTEPDYSHEYDYYWETGIVGNVKSGGIETERFRFDENGNLTHMQAIINLMFNKCKDEDIFRKCEENYSTEVRRIISGFCSKYNITEDIPEDISTPVTLLIFDTDKYHVEIRASKMYTEDGPIRLYPDDYKSNKWYPCYAWMNIYMTEIKE